MSIVEAPRVPVYFRERDLPAAYALAARLEANNGDSTTSLDRDSDSQTEIVAGWTAAQIRRAYVESPRGMKLIFDGMINSTDTVLTSQDLARFLTHKPEADAVVVRGTMGAFANRCVARYGRGKRDFPFQHWYVDGGFARYLMPRAVADVLEAVQDPSET